MAGEIVSLDLSNAKHIKRASRADTTPTIGVISTAPGVLLGKELTNAKPVALSGRVPVKVNNEGGVIAIGDRITLSSVSGVGTKATTTAETIGIALEAFNGTTGTVEVFVERRNNFLTSQFYVDSNGNVGIGTTTPAYKLHVLGDVAATSFINISTRDAKKDISHLTPSQETDFLAKIKTTNIAKYHYNIEDQNNPLRLGLIAEEAPAEILSVDGKGVDVYKMATFTLGGVKALQKEIEKMKIDLVSLQASAGASASSADKSSGTGSDGLFAWILNKFMTTLGIGFEQGKICLEDVCVNKTQLKELLEKTIFLKHLHHPAHLLLRVHLRYQARQVRKALRLHHQARAPKCHPVHRRNQVLRQKQFHPVAHCLLTRPVRPAFQAQKVHHRQFPRPHLLKPLLRLPARLKAQVQQVLNPKALQVPFLHNRGIIPPRKQPLPTSPCQGGATYI